MSTFNLSRWALEHKSFVLYLMLVVALAGIFEYGRLGRDEDPPFTIKTMVVKTLWPGATSLETMRQITDRIEKKLEELPNIDYLKSYTKPGESARHRRRNRNSAGPRHHLCGHEACRGKPSAHLARGTDHWVGASGR
jgi:hypothetical protein